MPRRLLVIANPTAGGGRARALAPALAAALQPHGITAEVHFTIAAGDALQRARAAGCEPWDGIVAVGGDGTVNEVLNGMPDPSRRLGVLPLGTANVLAAELRLPRTPDRLAALLASGHTRSLAIGLAGERRFLLFCGVGVDGAVVQRLAEVRTGTLGKHKWLVPILHVVRHWPQFHLRAAFTDGEVLDDLSSVLVTRVRNYGGVLHLPRGIDAGSGLLHVLCFRQRSRAAWLLEGLRGFLHVMRPSRSLVVKTTTAVTIAGDAPYQIDGDRGGASPIAVRLLDVRANVFAPM
ncbi:MAG TPA: diacylglycerol kinase family protein [Planctomycetota bacterium]|nr:diacylglycerol kinase family protein [Planctomycetota bacterium]